MIPQELRTGAEWCGWRYEMRNGQRTKVPINLKTFERAKSNEPETFASYDYVEEARDSGEVDGFGIRVANGFCAIDIDKCIVDNELSDLAQDICDMMQCYTELSPSKHGLRIICKANIDDFDKKRYYIKNPNNGVEIYATGVTNRFVTITGNTLLSYPVKEATDAIYRVLDKYMLRSAPKTQAKLSDEDIIQKASKQDSFRRLFAGDMSAYNNDHSSADLALCNMLAFWTGKDAAQMDSIFRRSGLYRVDKWARDDYRNWTLNKAIEDCVNTYSSEVPMDIWTKLDVRSPLNTGEWHIDTKNGVYTYEIRKKDEEPQLVSVVSTPVVPACYLENRKLGLHKVELHFIHDGKQRTLVCDKETIYNKSKVVSLANSGIPVTSNTAANFVRYLSDLERLNANVIPHYQSTSVMGWMGEPGNVRGDGTGYGTNFMPFDDSLVFDGESENYQLYKSITQEGNYDEWVDYIRPLRQQSLPLRLMMASSFASPLISVCNALPFVCHLWGSSGYGKSVSLMVAMSVWGNPEMGELVKTMNMTNASMMSTASFLNDLPFAGDELQTIKEHDMRYDKLIMQITEGIERGRMHYNKNLPTRSWKCAFLFTGEEPCVSDSSGGGTKNRVVEINYTDKIVPNGNETATFVRHHYGHAGLRFIEYVAMHKDEIRERFNAITQNILAHCDTTDKQAMAGALILLGDELASQVIFRDAPLTVSAITPFLKSESEVLTHNRAYDSLVSWVVENGNKFEPGNFGDLWGVWDRDNNSVFILDRKLNKALQDMNFSFDAVKKQWAADGRLVRYKDAYKKKKSINGKVTYVVEIKMPEMDFEEVDGTFSF
ncbi:MAG: DUF927 domain-containing protein [Prevotella sp.]|nr:DUF927 domain-containing protein [Prevotella sp.]